MTGRLHPAPQSGRELILYTLPDDTVCRLIKRRLDRRGKQYREVEITPHIAEVLREHGATGETPVLVVCSPHQEKLIEGFQPVLMEEFIFKPLFEYGNSPEGGGAA